MWVCCLTIFLGGKTSVIQKWVFKISELYSLKKVKYDRMKMKMSMVSLVFSFIFDFLHVF